MARLRVMTAPLNGGALVVLSLGATLATILLFTKSEELALVAIAVFAFCTFLIVAPPFWLAILLVVLIPFEGLITALLGDFNSSARQWFSIWKEVLLAIGIFRVCWRNPRCRQIIASNRWILSWTGLSVAVYCATLLRLPSVPAIFSLDLETRFLGVMLFFMFLDLDGRRIAFVLRAMVLSVCAIAAYGLIQYAWDYERLLPYMFHVGDLYASGTRRLYSYALSIFDSAYGSVIAIVILFAGAGRITSRFVLPLFALLVPCLLLTYVRSAYIGLLFGIVTVCIIDRVHIRRHASILGISLSVSCMALVVAGSSELKSNLRQRFESIGSQTDDSSTVHKESLKKAVKEISANPFGLGLGMSGWTEAKVTGELDEDDVTEDWLLQTGVQTGVLGAVVWLGLTGAILLSLLRPGHYWDKDAHLLRVSAAAAFVAMTVASVMIPLWVGLVTSVYAWALVGMALATCRIQNVGRKYLIRPPAQSGQ
jgi:hypothetical protein